MRIVKFTKREMIDTAQLVNTLSEMAVKTALDFHTRKTCRLRPKRLVHKMIKNEIKKAASTLDKKSIASKKYDTQISYESCSSIAAKYRAAIKNTLRFNK
jgi:hypothetical protein